MVRAIDRAVGRYDELQTRVRDAAQALSWDTDSAVLQTSYG